MIEVDKIKPNPYQPRKEFNEDRLRDLADSIRQYGVLQPLVVTRKEVEREDGSLFSEYELIAGERRLRASKIAGITMVPALIRTGEQSDKLKLEMAIIENLQREDLNPVDRAQAFIQLAQEFNLKHNEIAKRVGKSREYVSNTIRILGLPQEVLDAVVAGKITEGHTRPILMLVDRPEEQMALFREIIIKRLNVRESEAIARRIAYEKVRRKESFVDPDIIMMEEKLMERLGTRVKVEKKPNQDGGRVTIDFVDPVDLRRILELLDRERRAANLTEITPEENDEKLGIVAEEEKIDATALDEKDDELYFVRNFSL